MTQKKTQKFSIQKLKINKVITPSQWNKSLYTPQAFSRQFKPSSYNYWDYQKDWFNLMFLRPYTHSWFIWFKKVQIKFPNWFLEWFYQFGPTISFQPTFALKGYNLFKSKTNYPEGTISYIFFHHFWSLMDHHLGFTFTTKFPSKHPTYLAQNYSIKWWAAFQQYLLST